MKLRFHDRIQEGDLNEAARAADATRACNWAGVS